MEVVEAMASTTSSHISHALNRIEKGKSRRRKEKEEKKVSWTPLTYGKKRRTARPLQSLGTTKRYGGIRKKETGNSATGKKRDVRSPHLWNSRKRRAGCRQI
ncbi:hypothetical protein TNCV_3461661 [Trichonephila clavipes]|nr:hypothetical protein TNCV_3461661 [Trichonephila clavipes]